MSQVKESSRAAALLKEIETALFKKPSEGQTMLDAAGIESAFALLGREFDQGLLSKEQARALAGSLMQMAKRDVAVGFTEDGMERALRRLNAAHLIHEQLAAEEPQSFDAIRRVSVTFVCMADLIESRGLPGDHEQAFTLHQQSVTLREKFLQAHPDSVEAARDTVFGLNKLADFFFRRRQAEAVDQALVCYQRDLQICQAIYEKQPDLHGAARDVAFSANKLADFYSKRGEPGDETRALPYYRRALRVCEEALDRHPPSLLAARDLSVALNKMAEVLYQVGDAGDRHEALAMQQRMLQLREEIFKAKPAHPQAAADLVAALLKVADALTQRGTAGDADRAYAFYARALELQERMLAANPNSIEATRDVAAGLERLADLLLKRNPQDRLDEVIAFHDRSLALRQRIARVDANTVRAATEFSISLIKLASALKQRGSDEDMARLAHLYELNAQVNERLYKAHPDSARIVRNRIVAVELLASHLEQRQQPDDAHRAQELRGQSATLRTKLVELLKDDADAAAKIGLTFENLSAEAVEEESDVEGMTGEVARLEEQLGRKPGDSDVQRQLAATLISLAEALEQRQQGDDQKMAVEHRRRSVFLRSAISVARPDDFDDANEHLVALEALARAVGRQAHDSAQMEAFVLQKSALDISLKLAEGGPHSMERRRMMVVSLYLTHECALAAGDGEQSDHYLDLCHELLRDSITRGMEFDDDLMELYARLEAGE